MNEKMSFSAIISSIREQVAISLKGHREAIPINAAYAFFFCIWFYMQPDFCMQSCPWITAS